MSTKFENELAKLLIDSGVEVAKVAEVTQSIWSLIVEHDGRFN